MQMFKTEGKGALIEIADEPIFSLKTTIDYLVQEYSSKIFNFTKILQTCPDKDIWKNKFLAPKVMLCEDEEVEILIEGTIDTGKINPFTY